MNFTGTLSGSCLFVQNLTGNKNRIIVPVLVLAYCLCCVRSEAQGTWQSIYQTNTNISLTPPSPTAASFQQYGITPVSYNSGLPNISIPVYEVKAGDLSMPITVSYHSNGLKPKEEAGWTGLGWNLNVGGCITRMKRGSTDGSRLAGNNFDNISPYDSVNNAGTDPNYHPFKHFLFNTYFNQTYDTEPDIFIFNFFGHQGKFLYIRNKPYFIEYEKWKVTKISGDAGWQITDDNGVQYLFTNTEITRAKQDGGMDPLEPQGYVSCWQLTRVTSPDQQHWISFAYSPYTFTELGGIASQKYKLTFFEGAANFSCGVSGDYMQTSNNAQQGNYIAGLSLSFLQTSEGQTVRFLPSGQIRKDEITGQNALSQIVVYGQAGNPDTVIKHVSFRYGYFGDSTSFSYARLKLSGVYESSATGDTLSNYSFEYQNEFDPYPNKMTLAVDQWGYYNSPDQQGGGGTLLPAAFFNSATLGYLQTLNVPYGDVNPHISFGQMGMISKIHYPTGGYSIFTYEQNRYAPGNGAGNVIMVDTVVNNTLFYNSVPPLVSGAVGSFSIHSTYQTKVYISYYRTLWDSLQLPLHNFVPIVTLKRFVSGVCDTTPPTCIFDTVYTSPQLFTTNSRVDSIYLDPGNYIFLQNCESNSFNTKVAFKFQVAQPNTNENGPGGPGLRIADVQSFADPVTTTPALEKSYVYTDSAGLCSGVLSEDPKFAVYRTEEKNFTSPHDGVCSQGGTPLIVYNLSSDNNGLFNANLNFKFYYSAVREYTSISQANNYYTEHYFSPILLTLPPQFQNVYGGIGPDLTGLLDNEAVFEDLLLTDPVEIMTVNWKNTGHGYTKVSMDSTSYNMVLDTSFRGIRPILLSDATINDDPEISAWSFNEYNIYSAWRYPASKRQTLYDSTGNQYVVTTKYAYNTVKRELVTTEESINNGKSILTKYKYPDDYEYTSIYPLYFSNMTNTVVETQVWSKTGADSAMIKGVADDFDPTTLKPSVKYFLFTAAPVPVLNNETTDPDGSPSAPRYTTLLSDSRYNEKIRIHYEATGNIIETESDSSMNVPTSYVWGYHHLYPVAKVTGTRFSTVLQKIDTSAIQGITNDSLLRLALSPLRSIPGAQATVYTYTPFVGVTSETDINGRTTYYEYDEFNRLMNIRDFNHNILKTYSYHYETRTPPPVPPPPANVVITSVNTQNVAGFTALFTNTVTSQQYSFSVPAAGGTLGNLPAGNYNITISKSGNATQYSFYVNCNSLSELGLSATFNNVAITVSACNGVTIDSAN